MPCGATGVASTVRDAPRARATCSAAIAVDPVAMPSSTMIAVLPVRSRRGRSPRNRLRPALELGALGRLDGGELLGAGPDGRDDVVVEDAHAALADRPHAELLVPGRAELAHDDHVERCAEGAGDLGGDGHAAARQAEHDDVVAAKVVERRRQPPPGVDAIGEPHAHQAVRRRGQRDGYTTHGRGRRR